MSGKIVVPEGMLKVACDEICELGDGSGRQVTAKVLEAALRWLSENPQVPTDEQWASVCEDTPGTRIDSCIAEWQRRMFLAPEPKIVDFENVKRHIFSQDGRVGDGPMVLASDYDALLEAYRRGQKASAK